MQARPVQNHKHHSNDDTKPHRTVTTANICVHIHTAVHRLALSSLCDRQTDRHVDVDIRTVHLSRVSSALVSVSALAITGTMFTL